MNFVQKNPLEMICQEPTVRFPPFPENDSTPESNNRGENPLMTSFKLNCVGGKYKNILFVSPQTVLTPESNFVKESFLANSPS